MAATGIGWRAGAVGGVALALVGLGAWWLAGREGVDHGTLTIDDIDMAAVAKEIEQSHMGRTGLPEPTRPVQMTADGARIIDWNDLVPAEGLGEVAVFDAATEARVGMPGREAFGDISQDELAAFVQDIDAMRSMQMGGAAIRGDLDGVEIRMAGYVTPVGFDAEAVTEFLLVPFLGACIHVPPPPANQIVYATEAEGLTIEGMWEPIWVTGTLRAEPVATVLADVGYRIEGARVEPYL